ncbi:fluoride efflux transporter CrcB [Sphingomonas sp. BN140010]|uniref:Fluoride-specific ion channel FluC n=1 Tax=Sphingomonas arvum TaxID=2992113 RepID=A0ABT3JAY4_9SPHN|nr:fluoride efflux transporter CrcB [Sphingomonas sp. BN140010]MCW3796212.1 fluoride efflux transporter CrcB [Sphingomonas sp. BN140010]
MNTLVVFLGGGIGAVLRHGVNRLAVAWFGLGFPVGTLAVNVAGSFLMALAAGLLPGGSQGWRLFLATGVLGGFTTFSAFSLDALTLWQRGQAGTAALYVGGSVLLSLAAIALGAAAARLL